MRGKPLPPPRARPRGAEPLGHPGVRKTALPFQAREVQGGSQQELIYCINQQV